MKKTTGFIFLLIAFSLLIFTSCQEDEKKKKEDKKQEQIKQKTTGDSKGKGKGTGGSSENVSESDDSVYSDTSHEYGYTDIPYDSEDIYISNDPEDTGEKSAPLMKGPVTKNELDRLHKIFNEKFENNDIGGAILTACQIIGNPASIRELKKSGQEKLKGKIGTDVVMNFYGFFEGANLFLNLKKPALQEAGDWGTRINAIIDVCSTLGELTDIEAKLANLGPKDPERSELKALRLRMWAIIVASSIDMLGEEGVKKLFGKKLEPYLGVGLAFLIALPEFYNKLDKCESMAEGLVNFNYDCWEAICFMVREVGPEIIGVLVAKKTKSDEAGRWAAAAAKAGRDFLQGEYQKRVEAYNKALDSLNKHGGHSKIALKENYARFTALGLNHVRATSLSVIQAKIDSPDETNYAELIWNPPGFAGRDSIRVRIGIEGMEGSMAEVDKLYRDGKVKEASNLMSGILSAQGTLKEALERDLKNLMTERKCDNLDDFIGFQVENRNVDQSLMGDVVEFVGLAVYRRTVVWPSKEEVYNKRVALANARKSINFYLGEERINNRDLTFAEQVYFTNYEKDLSYQLLYLDSIEDGTIGRLVNNKYLRENYETVRNYFDDRDKQEREEREREERIRAEKEARKGNNSEEI